MMRHDSLKPSLFSVPSAAAARTLPPHDYGRLRPLFFATFALAVFFFCAAMLRV